MLAVFRQPLPQALTSIVIVALAGVTIGMAFSGTLAEDALNVNALVLATFLLSALVISARFPIQLRNNVKLMILTVPLYLMAVLLTPPLAAVTAGAGMLLFALDSRKRMGLLPSDIATSVGRWIITIYLTSLVAHAGRQVEWDTLALGAAAVVMFVGDIIGTAFEVAPMSGESPWHLMRVLAREMSVPESVQYLIGYLGAVVALQNVWALLLLVVPTVIVYFAFKRLKELQESTRLMLQDMADAVDLRDPYTGGHSRRVAEQCEGILRQLNISGPEAELIRMAARVHDIGKVGVPEEILMKPGALTPEERRLMETHVTIGADLLKRYPNFGRGKEFVRHHHERWDGKGYPSGLKGMEIPLGARVIAVADSFDAMTSDRPYRRAFSSETALQILREGRGTQWDSRIVDVFIILRTAPTVQAEETTPLTTPVNPLQTA